MLKMSAHAQRDRIERLVYLMTEIGIGEVLLTLNHEGRKIELTEHGIIIIYTRRGEVLTAYLASTDRAYAMYRARYGDTFIPPEHRLRHIQRVNDKHCATINAINLFYGYKEI